MTFKIGDKIVVTKMISNNDEEDEDIYPDIELNKTIFIITKTTGTSAEYPINARTYDTNIKNHGENNYNFRISEIKLFKLTLKDLIGKRK